MKVIFDDESQEIKEIYNATGANPAYKMVDREQNLLLIHQV